MLQFALLKIFFQEKYLIKKKIWVKRPGTGDFLAEDYYKLFGRLVKNKIPKNTQIRKEDVEN